MLFTRISYRIAAQFTAFVFLLLLITGGIFLSADVVHRARQTRMHLEQILRPIINRPEGLPDFPSELPRFQRDRVRVLDADGNAVFSGELYQNIPFVAQEGITTIFNREESYDVLTLIIRQAGISKGFIQIADRSPPNDLDARIFLFLLISAGISGLTFGVGLFFARRSLKPAEQMMQRLEQFTQDASHELRTPITAIGTSLDLALATDDYRENVLTAKKDLKEVSVLIERLLELARLDAFSLHKESVDLSQLVATSIEKHQAFAEEKMITIKSQIAPNIRVQGDPSLMRQILSNLLMNAIKFNKPNGSIDVKLTARTLSMHDTGKGIAAEALPHIFDRFYQQEASRTKTNAGLGLGLALVKRIVDLHGWTIDVKSEPKKGTTFTLMGF